MKMLAYLSMIMTSLMLVAAPIAFADDSGPGLPEDSTDMLPSHYTNTPQGYVLASGLYNVYCDGGSGTACNQQVSTTQCSTGYNAKVTIAPVWNSIWLRNVFEGYFFSQSSDTQPTSSFIPTPNSAGGYNLHFDTAYAFFRAGENEYVTINYTVYCMPVA